MAEVVILPGLDGTTRLLTGFCSLLGTMGISARAIAYPPDQVLGYHQLEPFVRAQLPKRDPFVLLGESFSGPLAIRIAASPPTKMVGLVLSTTFSRAPFPAVSWLSPLLRFAPAHPPMAMLSWWLLGRWATPALHASLAEALREVQPSVLRERAADALRVDVSKIVPNVRVPTLQLVGAQDRLLSPVASRFLADHLPGCRTVTAPGPHLLLQTFTESCAREVAAFVRDLEALPS